MDVQFKPWLKLDVTGDIPLRRQGHAVAVVHDRAYVFGGSALSDDSSSVFYNDLYCVHLGDVQNAVWETITQSGDIPSGREGHSLCVVGADLYLLSGVESDGASTCVQGPLYILNTDTHCWSTKEMSGDLPQAQSSSCVVTNDGRIVTFGGVLSGKACNDTHIMDTDTLVWTFPETTGTKPASRCDHGCVIVDNKMYLFGGSGGESLWFNDLSYLDLDTFQWVIVQSAQPPCPRDYPSLLTVNIKVAQLLVVFGGFTGLDEQDSCLNDTHYLSIGYSSLTWYPVTADESRPDGRYGHVAFVHDNKIYIQGGQNDESMFSDLWMLEIVVPDITFSPTIPPERDYSTVTPIPVPRKKLPLPASTTVCEQRDFDKLRSQYVEQIGQIFDTLTQKFQELDEMAAKLHAEREQFEQEREELHSTYDKQQQELQEVCDRHQRDNEKWVETIKEENDNERRAIAEEKARLAKEKEDLEAEREKFNQKSTKLDEIMRQVQGLK